jgi:hypothetical protein
MRTIEMRTIELETWRNAHKLTATQAASALGISNWKKKMLDANSELDYSTALLTKLYDMRPGPVGWKARLNVSELFQMMFGAALESQSSTQHVVLATVDCRARFSALLGVGLAASYRWGVAGANGTDSMRAVIDLITRKLSEFENPGKTLTDVGGLLLSQRGIDIDVAFPMPSENQPYKPRQRRGRKARTTQIQYVAARVGSFSSHA